MVVIARFVELLFTILTFAILARALLSWFPLPPGSRIAVVLNELTEPVLAPVRRFVPSIGGLDLSPFIAIVLLQVLQAIILSGLRY